MRFLHSGCWEHELFPDLCEYREFFSLLLSRGSFLGPGEFSHRHSLTSSQMKICGEPSADLWLSLPLSPLWWFCTVNFSHISLLKFSTLLLQLWETAILFAFLPALQPGAIVLLCLFPFPQQLLGWAAWCLVSENHCFIYFVLVFSYVRQKSKFSPVTLSYPETGATVIVLLILCSNNF